MRLVLILLLLIFKSGFICAQEIHLNSINKKRKTTIIKEGDFIFLKIKLKVIEDPTLLSPSKANHELGINGNVEKIDSNYIILKMRKHLVKVDYDEILQIKKEFVLLQNSSFLCMTGGSLIYLHSVNYLFFGPISLMILGTQITHRILWTLILNPKKNVTSNINKRKNNWTLQVFI